MSAVSTGQYKQENRLLILAFHLCDTQLVDCKVRGSPVLQDVLLL